MEPTENSTSSITSNQNDSDMNFFQQLVATGNVDITMRIMLKNEKLTMQIMPGSDRSTNKPYNITGTGEELDAHFFSRVFPGVQEIKGLTDNLEEVKKDLQEKKQSKPAGSSSKNQPDKKPAAKKSAKPKPAIKKQQPEKKEEVVEAAEPDLFNMPEVTE